jgi:aryl-alcohol dehydrogenase-like predicted oxidoreductase
MEYVRLGSSGLRVSKLMFGAARFGELDYKAADASVGAALDAGVTIFDTADTYNAGNSELQLGPLLARRRDQVVLCTKVGLRVGDTEVDFLDPNPDHTARWRRGKALTDSGLSRKHIMSAIDDSLRRLGTDYVDLYQVHRYDQDTGLEETLGALDDLVHLGKIRYYGCSGFPAEALAQAGRVTEARGFEPLTTMQVTYSVVQRGPEQGTLQACIDNDVAVLAFGVVAGGLLSGRYQPGHEPGSETRLGSRPVFKRSYWTDRNFEVVERLRVVAEQTGRSCAQLAAGWVASRPEVTLVLHGFSTGEQVRDTQQVFERPLSEQELQLVEGALD